jgi:hypothetical protein
MNMLNVLFGKIRSCLGFLRRFLYREENPWANRTESPLKVELGWFTSANELREALCGAGIDVIYWADVMIKCISLVPDSEDREVELVMVGARELGLNEPYTTGEFLAAVRASHDYDLCPPECGPLARLTYRDNGWLLIAMEPILVATNFPAGIFSLYRCDGSDWLNVEDSHPDYQWSPRRLWLVRQYGVSMP